MPGTPACSSVGKSEEEEETKGETRDDGEKLRSECRARRGFLLTSARSVLLRGSLPPLFLPFTALLFTVASPRRRSQTVVKEERQGKVSQIGK
jgi:hypothetical protein